MALSSLAKLHINSSQLQHIICKNVDNNTFKNQERNDFYNVNTELCPQEETKGRDSDGDGEGGGGDAGGNDSDGGPKKQEYEQGVATVTATYISIIEFEGRIVNKSRIPFEKSGRQH